VSKETLIQEFVCVNGEGCHRIAPCALPLAVGPVVTVGSVQRDSFDFRLRA